MGFLDLFRKKNDIIKSVSSSISTTNKVLKQSKMEKYELTEQSKQSFWDNLPPMWRILLGGNFRYQEIINEQGRFIHSMGSLAEDIYILGRKFENSLDYPNGLFEMKKIEYPYKVCTINSMFGETSVKFGEIIEGKFVMELPNFSLLTNLDELVLYEDKIEDYSNLGKIKNLSKLTLVASNGTSSEILKSISELENLKELTLGRVKIDDVQLFSILDGLDQIVLGGCYTENGSLGNSSNPDADTIKDLLPFTDVVIRHYY